MLMRRWIERWRNSALLRRTSVLSTGTVLAQTVQVLNFVALAKLYSLADVGVYSVFAAIVGTLAPVALLSYEMLIPGTSDKDVAPYIKALLLLLLPLGAILILLPTMLTYGHAQAVSWWIAGAVIQRVAEMYNVRANRFAWISMARLAPPLVMTGLLVFFAVRGPSDIGSLIVWQSILTLVLGVVYAALTIPPSMLSFNHSWSCMWETLRTSANAPIYLMPSNLLNLVAYNVPVLVIEHWFGAVLAAQYAYVLRFGFGPVGLAGGTLYQVFYGFLSEAAREGNNAMFRQFMRARRLVGYVALLAVVGIALVYPLAFRYVLGPEWMTAGWIAMIFAPFFGAMLYLTPMSVSLNVFAKQHYELKTQAYYFAISVLSFGLAILTGNAWIGFIMFSGLGCLRYWLLLLDIEKVLEEHKATGEEYDTRP